MLTQLSFIAGIDYFRWLMCTGLPDFSGNNIPKRDETYPMATYIYQMVIKYSKTPESISTIFRSNGLHNLPKMFIFWFENIPSSNPAVHSTTRILFFRRKKIKK
jgi:hypothetical protein